MALLYGSFVEPKSFYRVLLLSIRLLIFLGSVLFPTSTFHSLPTLVTLFLFFYPPRCVSAQSGGGGGGGGGAVMIRQVVLRVSGGRWS